MTYLVKVPLVITKQPDGSDLYLYAGAPVPAQVQASEVARLVEGGFLTEVVIPDPEPEPLTGERPNEAGPGSAKDKWVAYAAFHEVDVDPTGSKEDIVAAVTAAGH